MAIELDRLTTRYVFETDRRGAREAQKTIQNIRQSLSQISKQFLIFGTGLSAGFGKIAHHSYKFSGEMNRLRRDTRATEAQFKALREQAIKLGSSVDYTTITISDAVRAQRELVKGGLAIGQAMKALPSVLDFVAATEIAVGDAALYTTKIMKGFKKEIEDIPMIHDSIAHAATSMGITHEQLARNLMRVSASANALGVGVKDATSFLSLMVDEGMIAERSVTSLERVLTRLATVEFLEANAQQALTDLGITIPEIKKAIDNAELIPLFEKMRDAGLDVGKASLIFGEDGMRAALKLSNSVGLLRDFRRGMEDIDGTMKQQAKIMNDELFGAINALISAWDAFQISLGQAGIAQTLKRITIQITELVNAGTEMDEGWKRLISTLLMAGPALIGAGLALQAVSFSLGGLGIVMSLVGGIMKILLVPLKLLLLAFSPIGLVFLGIVAAGAALILNWDKIKAKAKALKDSITKIFSSDEGGAINWFKGLFSKKDKGEKAELSATDFIIPTTDSGAEQSLINHYTQEASRIFAEVSESIKDLPSGIRKSLKLNFNLVLPDVDSEVDMRKSARAYATSLRNTLSTALATTSGNVKKLITLGVDLILPEEEFVEGLRERMSAAWKKARETITMPVSASGAKHHGETHGFMRPQISTGDGMFSGMFDGMKANITAAWNGFTSFVTSMIPTSVSDWVKGLFGGAIDVAIGLFSKGPEEQPDTDMAMIGPAATIVAKSLIRFHTLKAIKGFLKKYWLELYTWLIGIPAMVGYIIVKLRYVFSDNKAEMRGENREVSFFGPAITTVARSQLRFHTLKAIGDFFKNYWKQLGIWLVGIYSAISLTTKDWGNIWSEGWKDLREGEWHSLERADAEVSVAPALIVPATLIVAKSLLRYRVRKAIGAFLGKMWSGVTAFFKYLAGSLALEALFLSAVNVFEVPPLEAGAGIIIGGAGAYALSKKAMRKFLKGVFATYIGLQVAKIGHLFNHVMTREEDTDYILHGELLKYKRDLEVELRLQQWREERGSSYLPGVLPAGNVSRYDPIKAFFDSLQDDIVDGVNGFITFIKTAFSNIMPGGVPGILNTLLWPVRTIRDALREAINSDDMLASVNMMHTDPSAYDVDPTQLNRMIKSPQYLKAARYQNWMKKDAANYPQQMDANLRMLQNFGMGHSLMPTTQKRFRNLFWDIEQNLTWLKNAINGLLPTGLIGFIKNLFGGGDGEGTGPNEIGSLDIGVDTIVPEVNQSLNALESGIENEINVFKAKMKILLPGGISGLVAGAFARTHATVLPYLMNPATLIPITPTSIIKQSITKKGGLKATAGIEGAFGILGILLIEESREKLFSETKAALDKLWADLKTTWSESRLAELVEIAGGGFAESEEARLKAWGVLKDNVKGLGEAMKELMEVLSKIDIDPMWQKFKSFFDKESIDDLARFSGVVGGDLFTKALVNLGTLTEKLKGLADVVPQLKKVNFVEYLGPLFAAMIGFASGAKAIEGLMGLFKKPKKGATGRGTRGRGKGGKGALRNMLRFAKSPVTLGIGGVALAGMAMYDMFEGIGAQMDTPPVGPETEDYFSVSKRPPGFMERMATTARETVSPMIFEKMTDSMKRLTKNVLDFRGPGGGDLASTLGWFIGQLANVLMVAITILTNALNAVVVVIQKLIDILDWFRFGDKHPKQTDAALRTHTPGLLSPARQRMRIEEENQALLNFLNPLGRSYGDKKPVSAEDILKQKNPQYTFVDRSQREGEKEGRSWWDTAKDAATGVFAFDFFKKVKGGGSGGVLSPMAEDIMRGTGVHGLKGRTIQGIGTPPQAHLAPSAIYGGGVVGGSSFSFNIEINSQPGQNEEVIGDIVLRKVSGMLNNTVQDLADREVA